MNSVQVPFQLVSFINVQDYCININNPDKITVEFVVDPKVRVSSKDWIAIFPYACNVWESLDLAFLITYEFVLHRPINKGESRYVMQFSLKGAKNLQCGTSYQFVYYDSSSQVLGVSNPFRFVEPMPKMILPKEKLNPPPFTSQNQCSNNKENVRVESFKGNYRARNHHTAISEVVPWEMGHKGKGDEVDFGDQQRRICNNKNNRNKQGNRGYYKDIYNHPTTLQAPNRVATSTCPNCQRVGSLLSRQAELYTQIKNLAELNADLDKKICNLQKELELSQAAYQKLSVTLMHERDMKQLYQVASQKSVEYQFQPSVCVYQQVFMGLDYFQRPIFALHPVIQYAPLITQQSVEMMVFDQAPPQRVITVREPSISEIQRVEEKTKLGPVLKLKAIIGSQEEKIRTLTEQLAEFRVGGIQKVKVVAGNIDTPDSIGQHFNNNDGEADENKVIN